MAAARWLMTFRVPSDRAMRSLGYIVVIALAVFFFAYLMERKQSFAVSAFTEYLRVETVSEGADDWSLVAAHICIPKSDQPEPEQANTPSEEEDAPRPTPKSIGITANCADAFFDQITFDLASADEELTLSWTDDYVLEIRQFNKDALYIYVSREAPIEEKGEQPVFFQDKEIRDGSGLYIPLKEGESPRLALRGYVSLGEAPVRSDAMVVRHGQYEIRQDGWQQRKHVVATGDLFPGDNITFEREPTPFWSRWPLQSDRLASDRIVSRVFVSDLVPNVTGFNVVATTDPQFSSIQLTRVGGQPTRIPVSWAQRLTTDPLVAGIATLLGLMATILALRNNFFRR